MCDSFTGADLSGLIRQASLHALKDFMATVGDDDEDSDADLKVNKQHFMSALRHLRPSVSTDVSIPLSFKHFPYYVSISKNTNFIIFPSISG